MWINIVKCNNTMNLPDEALAFLTAVAIGYGTSSWLEQLGVPAAVKSGLEKSAKLLLRGLILRDDAFLCCSSHSLLV